MDNIATLLPPLLTGEALTKAMSRLPEYNPDDRSLSVSERLIKLADIYRIFVPTTMSEEIYHKLYTMTRMSLEQKGHSDGVRLLNATYRWMCGTEYHGVITGATTYPENIGERIAALGVDADIFDALTLARAAGSAKAVNIVLLGRFSRYFDFSPEAWDAALRDVIPARFLAMNLKAFESGRTSA